MIERVWHAGVVIEVDVSHMVGEVRLNTSHNIRTFDLTRGGILEGVVGVFQRWKTGSIVLPHNKDSIRVVFKDNDPKEEILTWVYEEEYDRWINRKMHSLGPEFPGGPNLYMPST